MDQAVAHTLDIGILTIINQRGSVDRFFDAGTAVFLRYVLRKELLWAAKPFVTEDPKNTTVFPFNGLVFLNGIRETSYRTEFPFLK